MSVVDKYNITRGFGLPDTSNRPTISPVVDDTRAFIISNPVTPIVTTVNTVVDVSTSFPTDVETKKKMWEEKRRLYHEM
jgi:hypothetical protein